jgi:protein TonB
MPVLHRIVLPALNALFITSALLYCMFLLVKTDDPGLLDRPAAVRFDWPTMPAETDVRVVQVKPPKPPRVEEMPHVKKHRARFVLDTDELPGLKEYPIIKERGVMTQPYDRPLVLAVGFPPKYPSRQLARGVEGYVVVGFSVTAAGEVFDPFVIEASPKGAFERSALTAILKFRYKAKTIAGESVSASNQRYKFVFEIDR